MWGNFGGDHWKPHHSWYQGLDQLGRLSHISSDTRKSKSSKKWRNSRHEVCALRAWWGITLGSTTSRWIETSQPRNLSQSGLMISALVSACFVVLFARPAWCFMPPGSYVQKPPTSTLGGTDDPNGTSREPRGWLQLAGTPGTLSSSKPLQTTTFLVLLPEFGCACVLDDCIQPWCAENQP